MDSNDILNRAYRNVPKEPTPQFNLDWVPTPRGIKYYWLIAIRKLTRK